MPPLLYPRRRALRYCRSSYDCSDGCYRIRVALWVFHKKRGDMGERNTEELKQAKGDHSDTRVGKRKTGVTIMQCSLLLLCIANRWQKCTTPEGVTTATHNVTLNSSGFRGILNGKYDLVIIDVHARRELCFIGQKLLSCELKIYQAVSCINHVCCERYTVLVISKLCIFRLCHNIKTNLFISGVLPNL